MKIEKSEPFSSGTEYEVFLYNWCERCVHCKLRDDGFPEFPQCTKYRRKNETN